MTMTMTMSNKVIAYLYAAVFLTTGVFVVGIVSELLGAGPRMIRCIMGIYVVAIIFLTIELVR